MPVDVKCGKCGEKISTMKILKSIKDTLKHYDNKCPSCGQKLSITDFSLDAEKNNFFLHFDILKKLKT